MGFYFLCSLLHLACQWQYDPAESVPLQTLGLRRLPQAPLPCTREVLWYAALLPVSTSQTGLLYFCAQAEGNNPLDRSHLSVKRRTRLNGVDFVHAQTPDGQEWTFAQLKNLVYLSTEPALVEEAVLNVLDGETAQWVAELDAFQLGVNLEASAKFYRLRPDLSSACAPVVWFRQTDNPQGLSGQVQLPPDWSFDEALLPELMQHIPASAHTLNPWLGPIPSVLRETQNACIALDFGTLARPQPALLIPFADASAAQAGLQALVTQYGGLTAYPYQTYTLQPVLDVGLAAAGIRQATLVVLDRFLVLASSTSLLERWVDALVVGNTLGQQGPAALAGLYWRVRTTQGLGYLLQQVALGLQLADAFPPAMQWQGPRQQQTWTFAATALNAGTTPGSNLLWQWDLPQGTIRQLWAIDAWDRCLIEDDQHKLLLLDTEGQIQWTKALDAPLVGSPQLVDRRNGQGVSLFLTSAKAIHALQPDGSELPGFPIPLGAGTSSGLGVGGVEPYLFYVSLDGRVYGLDASGRPLRGWNPGPRLGPAPFSPVFFQSAQADYLLVLNAKGQLHVLNRSARPHFPAVQLRGPFRSGPQWQWDSLSQRIVVADAAGKVQVVDHRGAHFSLPLTPPPSQGGPLFHFVQRWGDPRKDYLAATGPTLYAWAYTATQYQPVFQRSFANPIQALEPLPQSILVTLAGNHEVWVLNLNGTPQTPTPLAGDVATGFQSRNLIVTGVGNRVYGYGL